MRRLIFSSAAFLFIAFSASQADARRSVVDADGSVTLSGYCDLNGEDCTAQPLGFNVTLGGATYNSFVLYGDGAITLGDTAVSTSTITSATTLADYGVPVISSGIDNSPDIYFGGGFLQNGYVTFKPDHEIVGTFEVYLGSQSFKEESTIDITASTSGLDVKLFSNVNGDEGFPFSVGPEAPFTTVDPQLAGYYIPGVGDQEQYIDASNGFLEYSIPATVTIGATGAAPEPRVWTLMIAGLGIAGFALRSRRSSERMTAIQAS